MMSGVLTRTRPLTFGIPGGKVYINDFYTNTRGSFLNISITGDRCGLQCRHCRSTLLKDMIRVSGSKKLVSVTKKYLKEGNLNGMLISGGFDRDGKLDFKSMLDGIRKIKTDHPRLTVYMHTGFLDEKEAEALGSTGIDAVLVNLIKSKKAIEDVYNLKGRTYKDYIDTIKALKKFKVKTSPHIIIGLENGRLSGEFEMVEDAVTLKVNSIVFVTLKKVSREIDFPASAVTYEEVIRLVKHARELSPELPLSFGCAKPPGADKHRLEIGLIKAGIDSIAFPSEKTVRYAVENKIAHTFIEKCCANL